MSNSSRGPESLQVRWLGRPASSVLLWILVPWFAVGRPAGGPLPAQDLQQSSGAFGQVIRGVEYQSDRPVVREHLDPLLPLKPGDMLTRTALKQAIQALYDTGRFARIEVGSQPQEDGIRLVFRLSYNLYFNRFAITGDLNLGNRLPSELVSLPVGQAFRPARLQAAQEEVERYLHLDLLAAVPRYENEADSLATEAYQNLRTALLFARRDERGQVVLVTGTAPQEGKTTTIVNLARLLAGAGEKTVVVDCDLRRAQLHQRLGLAREPGFTDFFVRHEPVSALLRPASIANLFALTAGPLPPNPPALLARKALGGLLDDLRGEFDWVLIDSPPLASVTDALLLARHADIAVLVIQHNKVDKRLVKRAVAALRKVTPNLLGAVLNVVDVRARSYHYYYYAQREGARHRHGTSPSGEGPAGTPAAPAGA